MSEGSTVVVCPRCGGAGSLPAPSWAATNSLAGIEGRFVCAFIWPHPLFEPTRGEKVAAARWLASTHGDRVLLRAIRLGRRCPRPHGDRPWDTLWDRLEDRLLKAGVR